MPGSSYEAAHRRKLIGVRCTAPQEDGTALVSGFSGQLLKLFLANDFESMTPESVMLEAIKGGKYDAWTVVD